MLAIQAILMALIQSVCEFLPISSSAHLILAPHFLHFDKFFLGAQSFDISLHLGSAIAIVIYFREDFLKIFAGFFAGITNTVSKCKKISYDKNYARLAFLIIFATLPIAVGGIFLKKYAETVFKNPILIAICLIIFGYFLYFFDEKAAKFSNKNDGVENISFKNAAIIGFFQIFAIIPGISRSGITITAARILKINRETATKFSFLLAVPTILGAVVLEIKHLFKIVENAKVYYLILGIFCSALFSYLVIKFFLKYLKTHSFKIFFVYRLILGVIILSLSFIK